MLSKLIFPKTINTAKLQFLSTVTSNSILFIILLFILQNFFLEVFRCCIYSSSHFLTDNLEIQ